MNQSYSGLLDLLRGGYVSEELKEQVLRTANYSCYYCGTFLTKINYQVDHALPISKGGSSEVSNLRASCETCNKKKGDKTELEYRIWKAQQNNLRLSAIERLLRGY